MIILKVLLLDFLVDHATKLLVIGYFALFDKNLKLY